MRLGKFCSFLIGNEDNGEELKGFVDDINDKCYEGNTWLRILIRLFGEPMKIHRLTDGCIGLCSCRGKKLIPRGYDCVLFPVNQWQNSDEQISIYSIPISDLLHTIKHQTTVRGINNCLTP